MSANQLAFANNGNQPEIAIVGVGGPHAAHRLLQYGINSTIYEANTRIGGRMYSDSSFFSDNRVVEWGGELISSEHTAIRNLTSTVFHGVAAQADVDRFLPQAEQIWPGASPHISPGWRALACSLNSQGVFFSRKYALLFRSFRKPLVNPKPCPIIPPPGEICGLVPGQICSAWGRNRSTSAWAATP